MKKVVLMLIFLVVGSYAHAGLVPDLCKRLNVAVWVDHLDSEETYNEDGPLLGCERILGSKWSLRYFRNSHNWDSFLATRYLHGATLHRVELGAEVGLVTGYRDKIPSLSNIVNPALEGQFGKLWPIMQDVHPWLMLTATAPLTDEASVKLVYFGAGGGLIFSLGY